MAPDPTLKMAEISCQELTGNNAVGKSVLKVLQSCGLFLLP